MIYLLTDSCLSTILLPPARLCSEVVQMLRNAFLIALFIHKTNANLWVILPSNIVRRPVQLFWHYSACWRRFFPDDGAKNRAVLPVKKMPSISHGSVVTHFRCGGIFTFAVSEVERVLKIGHHVTFGKIAGKRVLWHLFDCWRPDGPFLDHPLEACI